MSAASAYTIRPIRPDDGPAVAAIIRSVMPEFGASGPGFAINDAEVDTMPQAYAQPGTAYFVIELDGAVCGGGGVAPLPGEPGVCELRKMYFLPQLRGLGAGRALMQCCLDAARALGYRAVYIETLTGMDAAQALYVKSGFRPIPGARGCTGHYSCDRYYWLDL